jgi:hypothetical protein
MQPDAHRRPIAIHVLPATPGLPLLPLASVLGAGSGMGSRSAADQRIYRQLIACAGSEFAPAADARNADLLLHPHDALEHPAAAQGASRAAAALGKPTAFLSASAQGPACWPAPKPAGSSSGSELTASRSRSRSLAHAATNVATCRSLRSEATACS